MTLGSQMPPTRPSNISDEKSKKKTSWTRRRAEARFGILGSRSLCFGWKKHPLYPFAHLSTSFPLPRPLPTRPFSPSFPKWADVHGLTTSRLITCSVCVLPSSNTRTKRHFLTFGRRPTQSGSIVGRLRIRTLRDFGRRVNPSESRIWMTWAWLVSHLYVEVECLTNKPQNKLAKEQVIKKRVTVSLDIIFEFNRCAYQNI